MKVQFTNYQKLKDRYEVLKEINEYQNDAICRLQKQIEKMKNCLNCKNVDFDNLKYCHKGTFNANGNYYCTEWELEE